MPGITGFGTSSQAGRWRHPGPSVERGSARSPFQHTGFRVALLVLIASSLPACSQTPSAAIAEADAFCSATEQVFEPELFAQSRVEFDLMSGDAPMSADPQYPRDFVSHYSMKPLRIVTLMAVQLNGGQAFGNGVALFRGAPENLNAPFADLQGDEAIVFSRATQTSECRMSRALLDYIDDYTSYARGDGHLYPWATGLPLAVAYYEVNVWWGSLDSLGEARERINALIEQGQCLEVEYLDPASDRPVARSEGSEELRDGYALHRARHSLSFQESELFGYRTAVVYAGASRDRLVHYCCNATLPGPCRVPSSWSANATAMSMELGVIDE